MGNSASPATIWAVMSPAAWHSTPPNACAGSLPSGSCRCRSIAAARTCPLDWDSIRAAGSASCTPSRRRWSTHAPEAWFRGDVPGEKCALLPCRGRRRLPTAGLQPTPGQGAPGAARARMPQTAEARHRLRLTCPLLALWGSRGRIGGWYDPLQLWRDCVDNEVTGGPVPAGTFWPRRHLTPSPPHSAPSSPPAVPPSAATQTDRTRSVWVKAALYQCAWAP